MVKNVKPGYVNPLEMIKKGGQTNRLGLGGMKTAEKKRKSLETEKQSLQNSLLLMKTTSGDSVGSEESIELLERKLEEIENRIKTGEKETSKVPANNFDVYCKGSGKEWTD